MYHLNKTVLGLWIFYTLNYIHDIGHEQPDQAKLSSTQMSWVLLPNSAKTSLAELLTFVHLLKKLTADESWNEKNLTEIFMYTP